MDMTLDRPQSAQPVDAIWNPNAASNWSLLFTPVFGSYLHEVNWRALGEPERATRTRKWLYASIGVILFLFTLGVLLPPSEALSTAVRGTAVLYLFIWYLASARPQAQYVKKRFGEGYTHRHWAKPLSIALGLAVGWLVCSFVLASIIRTVAGAA